MGDFEQLQKDVTKLAAENDLLRATLRGLVANCPWTLDAGGSPAFWAHMRRAQMLVQQFDKGEVP